MSEPRRILMVTDFYRPYVGGVEQHVRSLARALVRRGHHVAVATQWTPRSGPAVEDDDGVQVHRIRGATQRLSGAFSDAQRPWAPPIVDPLLLAGLARVVRREQPDVVHGHDWMARSAWPLCLGSRPLVLSLHYYTRSCAKKSRWSGSQPCEGPEPARCGPCAQAHYGTAKGIATVGANRLGARIDDKVARRYIAVSDATALGNGLAAGQGAGPGPDWTTIPNLLTTEVAAAQPPAGLPQGFILYVGDHRTEKGLDVLLEAYRGWPDAPPLVLLGERHGRSVDDLPPGVVAVDAVGNAEVLASWRAASFGVVPSVWAEPFGIVAIEAMSMGRPVVVSDVGGLGEIVDDGVTGLVVPPGDPDALRAAMARLAGDADLRRRLGDAAALATERFGPDLVAAQVEAVYEDAIIKARR